MRALDCLSSPLSPFLRRHYLSTGLGSIGPMVKAISSAQHAAYEILETIKRKPPIDARDKGETPSKVQGQLEVR